MKNRRIWLVTTAIAMAVHSVAAAQTATRPAPTNTPAAGSPSATAGVATPPGYVIGVDDDLSIKFWKDPELSAEVTVRSDGKVSLPLLNDVQADGYTPEQLNDVLAKAAAKFVGEPNVTVIVKAIRSRKVYVLGEVSKPGVVQLNTDMNVLQLIATVGGLLEYADKGGIVVVRNENGKERRFKFNYEQVIRGKDVAQNIALKPGDTVIVP
jgi:polysaccharide biosynthesis/export protein